MDIQDIQVFESEKKLVFFLRFLSFFSWKMETGERTSTPFFGPKKAIVIGNQMINYWMFHHFPIIFPSFSSIFPWIFSWIFPSRDHTPGLEQGRSHGGLLRLQLPQKTESKQWTAREFHRDYPRCQGKLLIQSSPVYSVTENAVTWSFVSAGFRYILYVYIYYILYIIYIYYTYIYIFDN